MWKFLSLAALLASSPSAATVPFAVMQQSVAAARGFNYFDLVESGRDFDLSQNLSSRELTLNFNTLGAYNQARVATRVSENTMKSYVRANLQPDVGLGGHSLSASGSIVLEQAIIPFSQNLIPGTPFSYKLQFEFDIPFFYKIINDPAGAPSQTNMVVHYLAGHRSVGTLVSSCFFEVSCGTVQLIEGSSRLIREKGREYLLFEHELSGFVGEEFRVFQQLSAGVSMAYVNEITQNGKFIDLNVDSSSARFYVNSNDPNVSLLSRSGFNFTKPTAIPEPFTWALLNAGFFIVGCAARSRRAVNRKT